MTGRNRRDMSSRPSLVTELLDRAKLDPVSSTTLIKGKESPSIKNHKENF